MILILLPLLANLFRACHLNENDSHKDDQHEINSCEDDSRDGKPPYQTCFLENFSCVANVIDYNKFVTGFECLSHAGNNFGPDRIHCYGRNYRVKFAYPVDDSFVVGVIEGEFDSEIEKLKFGTPEECSGPLSISGNFDFDGYRGYTATEERRHDFRL